MDEEGDQGDQAKEHKQTHTNTKEHKDGRRTCTAVPSRLIGTYQQCQPLRHNATETTIIQSCAVPHNNGVGEHARMYTDGQLLVQRLGYRTPKRFGTTGMKRRLRALPRRNVVDVLA